MQRVFPVVVEGARGISSGQALWMNKQDILFWVADELPQQDKIWIRVELDGEDPVDCSVSHGRQVSALVTNLSGGHLFLGSYRVTLGDDRPRFEAQLSRANPAQMIFGSAYCPPELVQLKQEAARLPEPPSAPPRPQQKQRKTSPGLSRMARAERRRKTSPGLPRVKKKSAAEPSLRRVGKLTETPAERPQARRARRKSTDVEGRAAPSPKRERPTKPAGGSRERTSSKLLRRRKSSPGIGRLERADRRRKTSPGLPRVKRRLKTPGSLIPGAQGVDPGSSAGARRRGAGDGGSLSPQRRAAVRQPSSARKQQQKPQPTRGGRPHEDAGRAPKAAEGHDDQGPDARRPLEEILRMKLSSAGEDVAPLRSPRREEQPPAREEPAAPKEPEGRIRRVRRHVSGAPLRVRSSRADRPEAKPAATLDQMFAATMKGRPSPPEGTADPLSLEDPAAPLGTEGQAQAPEPQDMDPGPGDPLAELSGAPQAVVPTTMLEFDDEPTSPSDEYFSIIGDGDEEGELDGGNDDEYEEPQMEFIEEPADASEEHFAVVDSDDPRQPEPTPTGRRSEPTPPEERKESRTMRVKKMDADLEELASMLGVSVGDDQGERPEGNRTPPPDRSKEGGQARVIRRLLPARLGPGHPPNVLLSFQDPAQLRRTMILTKRQAVFTVRPLDQLSTGDEVRLFLTLPDGTFMEMGGVTMGGETPGTHLSAELDVTTHETLLGALEI